MLRVLVVVAVVVAALVGLLVLAGIWTDDPVERRLESPQPVGQEPEAQLEQRASPQEISLGTQSIEIFDDRVSPSQLQLTAAQPVQIAVTNQSSEDCVFFIGDYLQRLEVPAGERSAQSLTLPTVESSELVPMGCVDDADRQGNALIEFRGVLPGQTDQESISPGAPHPGGAGQ